MAVETVAESLHQLMVSTDAGQTFKKVLHLQSVDIPTQERETDDITATDDVREVIVPVNFSKASEINFEYVLDPIDTVHTSLQTLYDTNGKAKWQIKFDDPKVKGYEFEGMIKKLSEKAEKGKKLRIEGTISIVGGLAKKLIS